MLVLRVGSQPSPFDLYLSNTSRYPLQEIRFRALEARNPLHQSSIFETAEPIHDRSLPCRA
jgi:hypothetical protein